MARRITCYKLIFQHKQQVSRSAALSWIIKLVYGTNNHMPTLLNSSLPPSLNLSTLGNEDSPIGDSSGEVATCLCFSHMTWDVPVLSDRWQDCSHPVTPAISSWCCLLCFWGWGRDLSWQGWVYLWGWVGLDRRRAACTLIVLLL